MMNERIQEIKEQCTEKITTYYPGGGSLTESYFDENKFAELIVRECIGILETEIELVKGYIPLARNSFDVDWHEGKILHFTKLIEKSKSHFGVE